MATTSVFADVRNRFARIWRTLVGRRLEVGDHTILGDAARADAEGGIDYSRPATPSSRPAGDGRAGGKRKAYLVLPTYNWLDQFSGEQLRSAQTVVPVLQSLAILPGSLEMYGREHDLNMLTHIMKAKDFSIDVDSTVVSSERFKRTVKRLVASCNHPDDVLVIAFCGHGRCEPHTRHGSLTFSDNQSVTSIFLDATLSLASGSVYLVLNCCMAAGLPQAVPHGDPCVPTSGIAAIETLSPINGPPVQPGQPPRRVDIFATDWFQYQHAAIDGTPLVKALYQVITTDPGVAVEQLQARLKTIWIENNTMRMLHAVPPPLMAPIVHSQPFTGRLFEQLNQQPKVLHLKQLAPPGCYYGVDDWPGKWGYD
jgi:hypothetical protein